MLDNVVSITTSIDTGSRAGTRAPSVVPDRAQQATRQDNGGFDRHFQSVQAKAQGQTGESGKNSPAAGASIQPLAGKSLPPVTSARAAETSVQGAAEADSVEERAWGERQALTDLPTLPVGVSISIEVMQEPDSAQGDIELSDADADALLALVSDMFPGVEGVPESILDALRNGGFARLRELVMADIERQANLDVEAELDADSAQSMALSALVASLQNFAAELETDETDLSANVSDLPIGDERAALGHLVARMLINVSESGTDLADDVEGSEKLAKVAELLGLQQSAAGTDESVGPEEQPDAVLNALATAAAEGLEDDDEAVGGMKRKPGSESSGATTNASGNANSNPTVSSSANNAASNTLVTDEAALVRQPMEAAAVRENVARLDTEALIKQHLERELPVRNSATEVTHRLTERLVLMVSRDIQTATIRLDPPDLGKLDIRITTTNEQVQVQVVTHQPVVRDLLEQHAHRLREMLEQQGFAKVDVNVSDQSQQDRERASGESGTGADEQGEDGEGVVSTDSVRRSVGLVDHYV